ncbi:MAG: nucleotidyltransferase domain-containing protein [Hyphomonadaceae bacterium]|nr:nucleotidyltransferase domain-containing protein [Hyphomonadaceae bacterium]
MSRPLVALMEELRALKPELRARFGVRDVSVFGSYARGDAVETSDLDLLVRFEDDARPTLFLALRHGRSDRGAAGCHRRYGSRYLPQSAHRAIHPRHAP